LPISRPSDDRPKNNIRKLASRRVITSKKNPSVDLDHENWGRPWLGSRSRPTPAVEVDILDGMAKIGGTPPCRGVDRLIDSPHSPPCRLSFETIMHECNILVGWVGMILGSLLGMAIGLRAESRDWAGGYSSFQRQALRLAHIAAFALGMINVLYGSSTRGLDLLPHGAAFIGSVTMIAGGLLMPAVCLAAAWRRPLKLLFPLPASCVLVALTIQAWAWWRLVW
jgi:hypothetical protein